MKIGVFDSGVGGLSVANAVQKAFPAAEMLLREDKAHVPYGSKTPAEIYGFVTPIFDELQASGCDVIVVACNTVTTTLIGQLRERYDIPLVGIEPVIKPAAALTKSKTIAVCATPTTLASPRFQELKQQYAQGITVLEPDCSDWSYMIQHKQVEEQKIAARITEVLDAGADVIVLGCTHYHWIENEIVALAQGRAVVLQPEPAIIRRLQTILETSS